MNPSQSPYSLLAAFLGGVAVSLTPCIYPLIPVTLSVIGVNSAGNKARGFILSVLYVTGVALVYALLGIVAGLTGSFFGKISVHPFTRIIVGIVIIIFGLSMWGIIPINTVSLARSPNVKKEGALRVFLLGVTSGFMVSPCVSPALFSILTYVTSGENMLYGAALLLSFAYGMGVILILAGTFSAFLLNLPKAGPWMDTVKKICSIVLLVIGLYFIILGIRR